MSYTSSEQVRHHLITPSALRDQVVNQPVALKSTDVVQFYGGTVEASSVLVKSIKTNDPTRVKVTLTGQSTSFASQPVVPGSVVVASDSSLGIIFSENVDYIIDYTDGDLIIKTGGSLSVEQEVSIWHVPFTLYLSGTDYQLRAERGEIKRLTSSSIADGETVYLDYAPVYLSFTDEIVNNAVVMANGMVESEVDPDGQFEADSTLGAAATYRALEIICRAAASRALAGHQGDDRTALVWIKLAQDYVGKSEQLLRAFHPPYDNPRPPARS